MNEIKPIAFLAALALGASAFAQTHGSAPVRVEKAELRAEFVVRSELLPPLVLALAPADAAQIDAAKRANARADAKRLQVGIARPTLGLEGSDGSGLAWQAVDGGVAARWDVVSPHAAALRIELFAPRLPARFELRFSGSADPSTVYGPFGAADFDPAGSFWSPVLSGERASIEIFVPKGAATPSLAVSRVSHLFASPLDPDLAVRAKIGESASCEIDLVCQSASDARLADTGKSVARMTFTDSGITYLCSGTLVGSSDGSTTPYFYSAAHCISTQPVATTLTTHWFFDRTGCGSGVTSGSYVQRAGGATLLYANTTSDVLLLRLNSTPPAGAWFSGWDATPIPIGSPVVGVHHPRGDWKKVSRAAMESFGSPNPPTGSFSIVRWSQGVTEGGSSGSGIFTLGANDYRLRGALWGGASACGAPQSDMFDFYSRLDLAYPSIKQWIDPPPTGMILTLVKSGAGTGTVTSNPSGLSCGATCVAGFSPNAVVTLMAVASAGSSFTGWSGACTGVAPCVVTMNAAKSVTASFAATAQPRLLDFSATSVDFGDQSMGTTSPPANVRVVNVGANPVTISSIGPGSAQFGFTSDCGTLAPGASCTIAITFSPLVAAGALNQHSPALGGLEVWSNAAGSPVQIALSGLAERSLVAHFYRSILRRAPDPQGHAYWESESQRLAAFGANVNEAWYALAMAFFGSAEYVSLNRTDAEFVTDLYRTFFNRAPDPTGLSYWTQDLFNGLPRGVALAGFMFSPEFTAFAQGIFGNTAVRPEIDLVMDFYRGILSRLPDASGFPYWLQRLRTAQCQGSGAVLAEVDAMSSVFLGGVEYTSRARSNPQFVGDLYNAFLRRGGDIVGVQYWLNQLLVGTKSRDAERRDFLASPEFAARVSAVTSAGCAQ